ncbi:MAG: rhodanese-like domain-containing protein [Pseudomonadota bacterium]
MSQSVTFETVNPNPNHDTVKDVKPEEVLTKKENVLVVDVRRPDEWEGELGHIQGATHIVLDELPQRVEDLPRDQTIVFVCRSGGRSGQASAFAQENGIMDVYNMEGGMLRWNELGFETEGKS